MSGFLNGLGKAAQFATQSASSVDTDGAHDLPAPLAQTAGDLEQTIDRGFAFKLADLPAYIDAVRNLSSGIDDRKFLLEKVLVLMSRLPDGSEFSDTLQKFVIDLLYKDLPHPPSGYLALPKVLPPPTSMSNSSLPYAFRDPDGANYNRLLPSFGQARNPYARSVPSTNVTPMFALPDSGLVFDTLLRREKEFVPHPGGISSLFFAFADLVIHSIFNTNHYDWNINDASSYLDLSPLYGSSQNEVDRVRRKDGTGRLWDDVFADSRLLLMPPSVCALLVILSRNHNFVAEKILDINERGNFASPPPNGEVAKLAQDEEIFQKARLVNSGFFMQIILGDYVGAILGLVRDGLSWRLNPRMTMRQPDHEFCPQGEGNVVSIEFNMLYRWHATLSVQDVQWTENMFRKIFEEKDFSEITVEDFKHAAHKHMTPGPDVKKWTFNNLKRAGADGTGRFNDDDIAEILQNATEWSAGAFGARGTPEVLRIIEILGIEQSRSWGACSLNEFRKFMGLKPYSSFKDWNPNSMIHKAAETLYQDIDNLELYTGLQAEQAKTPMPGAGLCPGFTISRAILADAVCLTRGDRFLTVDCTPYNYTSWGYQDCQYDAHDGSYGGMLTKLLFRHLPNHYPAGSAYAHFPFLVPGYIKEHLKKLPHSPVDKYTWTRPPVLKPLIVAKSYNAVSNILAARETFVSDYEIRLGKLTKGIALDCRLVNDVLLADAQLQRWRRAFFRTTGNLIKDKSVNHVGSSAKYIDIVKDVINLLPVHFVADEIVGLPLKSNSNPRGAHREQELYELFANVANYVLLNFEPVNDWHLRESALGAAEKVIGYVKGHLTKLTNGVLSVDGFSDSVIHWVAGGNDQSDAFLTELIKAKGKHRLQDLAGSLFAEVIPTMAHYSQAIAHVVNFYLDEERHEAREDLVHLTGIHSTEAEEKILAYVREALRLDPPVSCVYRTAAIDTQLGSLHIKSGAQILASVTDANLDASVFGPKPDAAVYNRPTDQVGIFGIGEYGLLSEKFFEKTVPQVLRVVFGLKNVRRGPRKSGQLSRFTENLHGIRQQQYINCHGQVTPWPASLILEYNAEA